jgi:hypothetical protein
VDSWLSHYRAFWLSNLASLKSFVEAEHAEQTLAPRSRKKKK